MPRYRFDGWFDTVLTGLSHAVNATLHRPEHGQPDGSTVVVSPGDEVETDEPFDHPQLVDLAADSAADDKPEDNGDAADKGEPEKPDENAAGDHPDEPDKPDATDDGDNAADTHQE